MRRNIPHPAGPPQQRPRNLCVQGMGKWRLLSGLKGEKNLKLFKNTKVDNNKRLYLS